MTDTPAQDLRSALEPFAALADAILSEAPSGAENIVLFSGCDGKAHAISMDQLRAASAALAQPADAPVDLNGGDKYTGRESELLQRLLDRYSENGGVIPLVDDHPGFMGVIRKWTAQPAENAKGGEVVADEYGALIAAGFDDYAAICALRTEPDGRFGNAYFYSDGQWRFQTGGHDLSLADGKFVRCVLTKPLYAHPPAAEPVGLRGDWAEDLRKIRFRLVWEKAAEGDAARQADKEGAPEMALGDGWRANEQETARLIGVLDQVTKALATAARTDDAGQPSGDVAAMIGTGKGVIPDAVLDGIIDNPQPADEDEAFTTVWLQLESRGYLWSESNVEKAHLGWLLARALPLPTGKQSLQVEEKAAGVGEEYWLNTVFRDNEPCPLCDAIGQRGKLERAGKWPLSPAAHADVRDAFVWIEGEPPHNDGQRILVENDRGVFLVYWEADGSLEWCWICPDGKHDDRPLRGNQILRWARIPRSTPPAALDEGDK